MNRFSTFLAATIVSIAAFVMSGCGSSPPGNPPPTGNAPTLSATATQPVANGDGSYSSTINWQTTNATEVAISGYPPVSASAGSGSQPVTLTQTTVYSVVATGPGGRAPDVEVTITISMPGPPKPTPAVPASVAANVTGSGEVTVTWSSVLNATSYNVYVNGVLRQASATSPFVVFPLTNGVQYSFTVTSVYTNPAGTVFESAQSLPALATPVASVWDQPVNVTWTLPTTYTDGSPIALVDQARTVVTIYSNTTGNVPWGIPRAVSAPGATSTQFVMTVTEGVSYFFTGTATLDGQVSTFAVPVSSQFLP
jgi:hypothetical protein